MEHTLCSEFLSKNKWFFLPILLSSLELFSRDDLAPVKTYDQEMLV